MYDLRHGGSADHALPRGRQEDTRHWGAGLDDCRSDGGNESCGGACRETDSGGSEGLPRKAGSVGGPTTCHGAPVSQTSRRIYFIISTTRDLVPRIGSILPNNETLISYDDKNGVNLRLISCTKAQKCLHKKNYAVLTHVVMKPRKR